MYAEPALIFRYSLLFLRFQPRFVCYISFHFELELKTSYIRPSLGWYTSFDNIAINKMVLKGVKRPSIKSVPK